LSILHSLFTYFAFVKILQNPIQLSSLTCSLPVVSSNLRVKKVIGGSGDIPVGRHVRQKVQDYIVVTKVLRASLICADVSRFYILFVFVCLFVCFIYCSLLFSTCSEFTLVLIFRVEFALVSLAPWARYF
jgi:hypothetical protein